MNILLRSISKILKGSMKAFPTFPASIASAFAFAIVTMIRIQLDWPQQEGYNFLFNCLHWSFALGAVFGLAAVTGAQSRFNKKKALVIANLMDAIAVSATFLVLFFLSRTYPVGARYKVISTLAAARVGAALLVSFITFIVLAGYPKEQSDFSRSLFMTMKALFVALTYGVVIMAGTSGVAGAIQALLYNAMSEKVYLYLGTISGFLAFTVFVGYFPDFRKGAVDERREIAQNQPRFIQILFGYIMIPILLALTVVLLIWAGRTILSGMQVSFIQLSGIATAYTVCGIWLHIMVTHYENGPAKFYRRIYPLAALVILAFEAWALIIQLEKYGLKTTGYLFIVTWIIALASAVLLLTRKEKAHPAIAALTCGMALISVLPFINYHQFPISAQVNRLENLLVGQGMLKNNQLLPAASEPELTVRESITDAVNYLAYAQDARLPVWFDKDLKNSSTFKTKLGFEQVWPKSDKTSGSGLNALVTSLTLRPEAIDIGDYRWAIDMQQLAGQNKEQSTIELKGNNATYQLEWDVEAGSGIPALTITSSNGGIFKENLDTYIDRISKAYPPGQSQPTPAGLKDMSVQFQTPELTVLLVFRNVEIRLDSHQDRINYWFDLSSLYVKENR